MATMDRAFRCASELYAPLWTDRMSMMGSNRTCGGAAD